MAETALACSVLWGSPELGLLTGRLYQLRGLPASVGWDGS